MHMRTHAHLQNYRGRERDACTPTKLQRQRERDACTPTKLQRERERRMHTYKTTERERETHAHLQNYRERERETHAHRTFSLRPSSRAQPYLSSIFFFSAFSAAFSSLVRAALRSLSVARYCATRPKSQREKSRMSTFYERGGKRECRPQHRETEREAGTRRPFPVPHEAQ
jgi:hypothetical protein